MLNSEDKISFPKTFYILHVQLSVFIIADTYMSLKWHKTIEKHRRQHLKYFA